MIDPTDSDVLDRWPHRHNFRDPYAWSPEWWTARFVPDDPDDLDVYDALYKIAFERMSVWILCDEASAVFPVSGGPKNAKKVLVQGRKRSIGHMACHTRPRVVARDLIAQSQHVLIWDLPAREDREYLAKNAGVKLDVLESTVPDPPGFAWFDVRSHTLTAMAAFD